MNTQRRPRECPNLVWTDLELRIVAMPGERWELNGTDQPEAADCIDVDLNFTPATNLIAIRRLALVLQW
jgi:uncharacterized protein